MKKVFVGLLLSLTLSYSVALIMLCTKKEAIDFSPKVLSVSGTVNYLRQGSEDILLKSTNLKSGDIIQVKKNSQAVIIFNENRTVYLNEQSAIKIEFERNHDNANIDLNVSLLYGDIFSEFESLDTVRMEYAVSTTTTSIIGNNSCFSTSYHKKNKITVVKAFKNRIPIYPYNKEYIDLHECNKILINGDGVVSPTVSITSKDVEELKLWLDNDNIALVTSSSGCNGTIEEQENLPPVWKSKPRRSCQPGKGLVEKLKAIDPEGSAVRYTLVKGPQGMKISEAEGIVHYKPITSGVFEVSLSATDESGNISYLDYTLTVFGKINANLRVPKSVSAGEKCRIDASRSVNKLGKRRGLFYRFDLNSDGKWDYPASGKFGRNSHFTYSFKNPGSYKVTVQIENQDRKTAVASKTITVNPPEEFILSYMPQFGTIGTAYTLTINKSTGLIDSSQGLQFRWDLNGDDTWDHPGEENFTNSNTVNHMWERGGVYPVRIEVKNRKGKIWAVTREITVYQGISIDELQGPDTVNVNENVSYICAANDPDFAITEYAWDLAGVGMSNLRSDKNSVNFSYKEAGTYTLVCSVINEKGMKSSASKDITVINFSTVVNAGGPYETFVNKAITLEGFVKDIDNTIKSYQWDFDNDGTYDWQSQENARTEKVFTRQGTYVLRFGVKTDDGSLTEDTATLVVINRTPKAFAGDNIVSKKNKKVVLTGVGNDPDGNISTYEWDFDADGTYDWSSNDTGYTKYTFTEYSKAVLKVTDSDGAFATDTVTIIICPKEMRTITDAKVCMDTYEWPNQKGKKPKRGITYEEALAECQNNGKRLCTITELTAACKGEKNKYLYPYGKKYVADNCNTFGNRHTSNRVAKSGEFTSCESSYGVFDMSGNVAEWSLSENRELAHAVGGWWQDGEQRSTCDSYIPLSKAQKYMYVGFRCCK